MDLHNVSPILSIVATILALISFMGTAWKLWRDRPRLWIYLKVVNYKNKPDGAEYKLLNVTVCNVGFRPTIITRCIFAGDRSSYHPGIHDEPAATYGIEDQKFPALINPGESLSFNPIGVSSIEKNMIDPQDPKHFFDPYSYMLLEDSFGNYLHINMEEIKWRLGLIKSWKKPRWRQKFIDYIYVRIFIRKAKFNDRF